MDTITASSAKEVLEVIYNSDIEIYMKIPEKLISLLLEISSEYQEIVNLKENTPIIEQPISDEAKAMLALIYKDLLADKEHREKLNKIYLEKQNEKIVINELFPKKVVDNAFEKSQEIALIEIKEDIWYKRIFLKIKELFRIK